MTDYEILKSSLKYRDTTRYSNLNNWNLSFVLHRLGGLASAW